MKSRLIVTFTPTAEVLERAHTDYETQVIDEDISSNELLERVQKFNPAALIVSPRYKISAEFISKVPDSLKIIATSSVGFDHLDIPAAKACGLYVTNTPDVLTECTADLTMMLLLNACRRGREYMEIMEQGWGTSYGQAEMLGIQVSNKTLGILGMGRIGRALADRARGFGMKILYCNNKQLPPELEKGATYFKNFKDMLPHCQILSLNAPSTPETRGIMNDETFNLLPNNAVLVNAGRGNLVDESALMRALDSKKLFAAGLDVFEQEPNYNQKLKNYHQVFMTPHMGSATQETRSAMGQRSLKNIHQALKNQTPQDNLW